MAETTNIVDTEVAQEAFIQDFPTPVDTLVTPVASKEDSIPKGYTEEDLKKVREQEKSKLYPQIDSLKEELNLLKKEREERLAEAERLRHEAEEEARRKAESEMDTRQLLELKEKEWAKQLEEERQERQKAFSLFERERQYSELQEYRNRRLAEEQENIMPELLDLVTGNTPDEVEQSITGLRERTSRILESAQSAMQNARREMTGTRVTSPTPLENNSDQQQFTAEQIASMSVTEYAKYRDRLLPRANGRTNKGIFG